MVVYSKLKRVKTGNVFPKYNNLFPMMTTYEFMVINVFSIL